MDLSRRAVIGFGASLLLPGVGWADAETAVKLAPAARQRIQALMQRLSIPGLAIAAVRRGQPAIIDAFGYASLPFRVPVDKKTLFNMASVGKQFTADLVMALVAAGKVGLDRPIGDYVPDVPPQFAACPVASLLSHTSGIPDYDDLPGYDGDRPVSHAVFLRSIAGLKPDFAPGAAWAYSNTGFVLLGHLIERVTGEPYRRAVTERLLARAGLAEGRVDDATSVIPGRAEPYVPAEDGTIRHAIQMDGDFSGWPDGGVLLSARDAVRWEAGLQAGAPVPAATQAQMTRPAMLATGRSAGYGFAWFLDRMAGRDMHYHSGSVSGFMAYWLRLPTEEIGIAVMLNLESEPAATVRRAALFETAELLAPGATCWSLPPIRDDDPALTERTRRVIAAAPEAVEMAALAPELACLAGKPVLDMAGVFGERQILEAPFRLAEAWDEPGGAHVRRYRAELADGPVFYAVGYDAGGRVFRIRDI